MKTILNIQSSISGAGSFSNKLSAAIIERLKAAHPEHRLVTRDVSGQSFPHLDNKRVNAFGTPREQHNSEQKELVKLSDEAVRELQEADILVIGVPMYNLSVPGNLRAWMDHVIRAGITFGYENGRPKGLLKDKKVYLAIASGGIYTNEVMRDYDFTEPYLRKVFDFLGLTDINTFRVEGTRTADVEAIHLPKAFEAVESFAF